MGGGPRTFPGGLNKWQYKRLHEKMAREKEKKLLQQEKQLYEARIRNTIRNQLSGNAITDSSSKNVQNSHNYGPMSAKDHIKALADRFMVKGAEDLWNEDDGPIGDPPLRSKNPRLINREPIDSRKLSSGSHNLANDISFNGMPKNFIRKYGSIAFCRSYSTVHMCNSNKFLSNCSVDSRKLLGDVSKLVDTTGDNVFRKNLSKSNKFLSNYSADSKIYFWDMTNIVFTNGLIQNYGNVPFCRNYSVASRSYSRFRFGAHKTSSSEDNKSFAFEDRKVRSGDEKSMGFRGGRNSRFSRIDTDDKEREESEMRGARGKRDAKNVFSGAALRNYDTKPPRRPPTLEEGEEGLSQERRVMDLRQEIYGIRERDTFTSLERRYLEKEESLLSQKRFDECNISPLTIKALSSAGYLQMTVVQEAAISTCLEGKDALVKAKTGTGKTAAFMIPAIEAVLKACTSNTNQRFIPFLALVLCPTRELASQIAAEANVLLKYHDGLGTQTLVGGTRFKEDQKLLDGGPCQIIVATPGRLLDHIENKSGFSVRLMGLKVLIVDEADLLLDLGFRKDMERIVDCLPRQRQSLLFSATIPKEVRRISQLVLKKDHVYIDTVGLGGQDTHAKVLQSYLIASHDSHFHITYLILKEHIMQEPDYKVIVFCTTGMVTSLLYSILRELKMNVRELHSRKPQIYRTRMSDEFRESKRLILITSDVSARGMDYPDVTLVVQVGIPSDREQYIHRLGRTGRQGKEGKGVLLLAPWEDYFLDEIRDLPIHRSTSPQLDSEVKAKVENSLARIDSSLKEAAYHAWLGYYNSIRQIGRNKTELVVLAHRFSLSIGLQNPPSMFRKTALKMGLRDIPGIRIRK
ncbi:hypothetical protein AMTRI_Chr07g81720 [Amborella trichopoda]